MPKGTRETAEQRAIRELAALEKKDTKTTTKRGKKVVGKPFVSDAELFQRQVEKDRKRLEQSKAAERKRIEVLRAEANAPKPPLTAAERGEAAGKATRQTASKIVSPVVKPTQTMYQTASGFFKGVGLTRKKAVGAALTGLISYGAYKIWGQDAPATAPSTTKPSTPTKPDKTKPTNTAPKAPEPAPAPAQTPSTPYNEDASKLFGSTSKGMTSKDLENIFKKSFDKNRYRV